MKTADNRYRKKPVVIEAVKYIGNGNVEPRGQVPDWMFSAFESKVLLATNGSDPLVVKTLEGWLTVSIGDYIIRGVNGELYPCKPDIFEKTYELAGAKEQPGAEENADIAWRKGKEMFGDDFKGEFATTWCNGYCAYLRDNDPPSPLQEHTTVEEFISTVRESFIGSEVVFTKGSCYQFYKILKLMFQNANAYYNSDHVITEISGKFYDITGEVQKTNHLLMDEHYPKSSVKNNKFFSDHKYLDTLVKIFVDLLKDNHKLRKKLLDTKPDIEKFIEHRFPGEEYHKLDFPPPSGTGKEEWKHPMTLQEVADAEYTDAPRCGICGDEMVLIRGKYPGTEKRGTCPTCTTERLEQINEISSKEYGKAYKNDKVD